MINVNDIMTDEQKAILKIFNDEKTIKKAEKEIRDFNKKTENFKKEIEKILKNIEINF